MLQKRQILWLVVLGITLFAAFTVLTLSVHPAERVAVLPTLAVLPSETDSTAAPVEAEQVAVVPANTAQENTAPMSATEMNTRTPMDTQLQPASALPASLTLSGTFAPVVTLDVTAQSVLLPGPTQPPIIVISQVVTHPVVGQVVISFAPDASEAERAAYVTQIGGSVTCPPTMYQ